MSQEKKKIREKFRNSVFKRDGYRCVMCCVSTPKNFKIEDFLDAHHITERTKMPSGGYVKENGITLCKDKCHLLAEEYLQGISAQQEFSPQELYKKIGSNYDLAHQASKRL